MNLLCQFKGAGNYILIFQCESCRKYWQNLSTFSFMEKHSIEVYSKTNDATGTHGRKPRELPRFCPYCGTSFESITCEEI